MNTEHPLTGTRDDDDDRDDERSGENEALVRETNDHMETPEEFGIDDDKELDHPEDDHANEAENEVS